VKKVPLWVQFLIAYLLVGWSKPLLWGAGLYEWVNAEFAPAKPLVEALRSAKVPELTAYPIGILAVLLSEAIVLFLLWRGAVRLWKLQEAKRAAVADPS
jgi:hypothetical protein